ncbi:hypothetical protein VTK56DRAFT_3584 [Thermocarpiscus australiensis]
MEDDLHLPIALRRTRRSLGVQTSGALPAPSPPAARTPAKSSRTKKRVRLSDPGPTSGTEDEASTTGLTPMIHRTSLSGNRQSRRHSNPARFLHASNGSGIMAPDSQGSPVSGEVRLLPLRQVLDGRIKRRIRRNGLSEEMNSICAERRRRAQETKAEIERLRAELAEKDEEIRRLHDETVVLDTGRVWRLEQQVEALKRELADRSRVQQIPSSPPQVWMAAARDPVSGNFMELDYETEEDEEQFGDATMAELACSTPTRRMRASFPTPPATSPPPAGLRTPCRPLNTPRSHVGIQASLPDPEKRELTEEIASLQLEVRKLTATLESYAAMAHRLSEKLAPFSPARSVDESLAPRPDVEQRLEAVLRTLSDRTTALAELNSSLQGLGFPGSDAIEIIDSLRRGFRTARLELEYLTPGEITLPLTSAGAAVLDLILSRLRDLAQQTREADDAIDEYHAIELSLRQQLNARVDAMDNMAEQLHEAEIQTRAKDARIAELELALDRLKGAVQAYARDLSELEALVERLESDLQTSNRDRDSALRALDQKTTAIAALQAQLSSATEHTAALQAQLGSLSTTHTQALADLTRAHGVSLAQRDARAADLRADADALRSALQAAHETARRLRRENARLVGDRDGAVAAAREVVDGVRAELERAVRVGEGLLSSALAAGQGMGNPGGSGGGEGGEALGEEGEGVGGTTTTPPGSPPVVVEVGAGGLLVGDTAGMGRGRKRRRFDSGLGLLDEEAEVDADA